MAWDLPVFLALVSARQSVVVGGVDRREIQELDAHRKDWEVDFEDFLKLAVWFLEPAPEKILSS
jgi:hypothetical protein